jgi:tRNA G18 (ribose-2'-O)-methylase SpoU
MNRAANRGYWGIGIVGSKTAINVGTLWRSAGILGAAYIFTAGKRFPHQASDTIKAWKHVPMFEYASADELFANLPRSCEPVAVELDGKAKTLETFVHPERACYILGAEDSGLTRYVINRCSRIVQIPGEFSLNVAVAGSIVAYDRIAKYRRELAR